MLNRSTAQFDNDTVDKLRDARRIALKFQLKPQQAPVTAWLWHHGIIHNHESPHSHKAFNLGMAALLAALLLGGALYFQNSIDHDHSDIDIQILTDDLPVDMYVD
jgi:hypothetical protein